MDEKTDALGQPLEKGKIYGYSKRSNGIVTVHVGELINIGKKRSSLNVLETRKAVYGNNPKINDDGPEKVQVTPNSIFPLDNYKKTTKEDIHT